MPPYGHQAASLIGERQGASRLQLHGLLRLPSSSGAVERVHHCADAVGRSTSRRHRRPGQSRLQSRSVLPARTWPARGRPDRAAHPRGPRRSGAAHSRSCPACSAIDRSPLCPPSDPFARARNRPSGRFTSSQTTSRSRTRRSCSTGTARATASPLRFMNVSGLTSSTTSPSPPPSRLQRLGRRGLERQPVPRAPAGRRPRTRRCAGSRDTARPDCRDRRPASRHCARRRRATPSPSRLPSRSCPS